MPDSNWKACPKCGGESFRIAATFVGSVDIDVDGGTEDFEVVDSNPTDSEWDTDSVIYCRECDWTGKVQDVCGNEWDRMVFLPKKKAPK